MKRTDFIGRRSRFNNTSRCKLNNCVWFVPLLALFLIYICYWNYAFTKLQQDLAVSTAEGNRIKGQSFHQAKEATQKLVDELIPQIVEHNVEVSDEETDYGIDKEDEEIFDDSVPDLADKTEKESYDAGSTGLKVIKHDIYWSNNRRFFAMDAVLFDGDEARPQFTAKTSDYLIVVYGIGEFTARETDPKTVVKDIPNMMMKLVAGNDIEVEVPVFVHTNGTYFQHKFHSNGLQKYVGEKCVWITGVIPHSIGKQLQESTLYKSVVGKVKLFSVDDDILFKNNPFSIKNINVINMIAPRVVQNDLVLCSAAIYHASGFRFLLEFILYHKIVGFDKMHLYFYSKVYINKVFDMLTMFPGDIILHDWSQLPQGAVPHVKTKNYEHAQRFTRNDCFFRNRGLSKYIAFSDFDEIFVPNYFDSEYESSLFLNELLQSLQRGSTDELINNNRFGGMSQIISYMDSIYEKNNQKIGFLFTSVTVPPNDVHDQKFFEDELISLPNIKVVDEKKNELSLYFNDMSVSEAHCTFPYNCGRYHAGRQKYILRVAPGSINPNNPLFYHAISEEYKKISDTLMEQIPVAIGHLRHFAGHFRNSRFGGLPLDNRKILPIPQFVLYNMKHYIESNSKLLEYYFHKDNEKEIYLNLNDFHNLQRFIKVLDHEEGYEIENLDRKKPIKKFITFDRYPGRLNNQLFTLDWCFRFSKAFKRTLYITKPRKFVHYVGLPSTLEEEATNSAIWNITKLRRNFDFIMYYEVDTLPSEISSLLLAPVESLPKECVWVTDISDRNLVAFMKVADKLKACQRIHFQTGTGLIQPQKSDTRMFGVGPLYFWSALEPNFYLQNVVDNFVQEIRENSTGKTIVSFHIRQFDRSKADDSICYRLLHKVIKSARQYLDEYEKCCQHPIFNGKLNKVDSKFLEFDVKLFKDIGGLADMCDFTEDYLKMYNLDDRKKYEIIFAHDNRNPIVQPLFESYGGHRFNKEVALLRARPAAAFDHEKRIEIETVLAELLSVEQADFFHGSGASTFSQVICFMRLAKAKRQGLIETSNICHLVLLSTGTYECKTMECSIVDAAVDVAYNLAN